MEIHPLSPSELKKESDDSLSYSFIPFDKKEADLKVKPRSPREKSKNIRNKLHGDEREVIGEKERGERERKRERERERERQRRKRRKERKKKE